MDSDPKPDDSEELFESAVRLLVAADGRDAQEYEQYWAVIRLLHSRRRGDRGVVGAIIAELANRESGVVALEAAEEILARFPDELPLREALEKWRIGDED